MPLIYFSGLLQCFYITSASVNIFISNHSEFIITMMRSVSKLHLCWPTLFVTFN